jgi:hypothetical protein
VEPARSTLQIRRSALSAVVFGTMSMVFLTGCALTETETETGTSDVSDDATYGNGQRKLAEGPDGSMYFISPLRWTERTQSWFRAQRTQVRPGCPMRYSAGPGFPPDSVLLPLTRPVPSTPPGWTMRRWDTFGTHHARTTRGRRASRSRLDRSMPASPWLRRVAIQYTSSGTGLRLMIRIVTVLAMRFATPP